MHRQIAGRLTGPVTKWIVLVAALVAGRWRLGASPRSSPTSRTTRRRRWLPASAESTRALEKLPSPSRTPTLIPTVVVYERDGGLTEADVAAMDATARRSPQSTVSRRRTASPNGRGAAARAARPVSEDGEVTQTLSPSTSAQRLERDARTPPTSCATSPPSSGGDVYVAGCGGQAADSSEAFEGIDTTLLLDHPRRGDPDPALHLPQPGAVDPADLSARSWR